MPPDGVGEVGLGVCGVVIVAAGLFVVVGVVAGLVLQKSSENVLNSPPHSPDISENTKVFLSHTQNLA